jgi:RNA polymerase sigma factor (TIGR02999 family)
VRGGSLSTRSREALTLTLTDARRGDKEAADELFSQVYDELRAVARRQLGRRRSETLDTAGLVHETYIRMVDVSGISFEDRAHFLSYAGAAMRTILIDHARRRAAAKRGGGLRDATLDEEMTPVERQAEQLFFIGEALDELEQMSPRLARVVECRFFAGMTDSETAAALGVSDRTVRRDWTKARACLHAALADGGTGGR